MEPIITVRGLGKAYRIRSTQKKRYHTLRDDLAEAVQRIWQGKIFQPQEEFWALKDVSFDVYPGEVLGIVGRNGAGKSTLLKILARVTQPSTGEAILRGRVASLLEVGTGFHPELTGRENIFMSGMVLGMKKREIQNNFDEIVAFAEVERFLDTPIKHYSSGMYVRLAFAVAAHLEPEILLVDEVLAVGDSQFQKRCLGKISEIARGGRTVLFVSHSMSAVSSLCNEALWIKAGRISQRGKPSEVISQYLTESSSSTAQVNLNEISNYNSSALASIQAVSLESIDGYKTNQFQMGEECIIKFEIFSRNLVKQIALSIDFKTVTGIPLIHLVDRDFDFSVSELNGKKKIKVILPSLCFYPGAYLLSVWIGDPMGNSYHYAEDCLTFEVSPGNLIKRAGLSWQQALFTCSSIWKEEEDKL